MKVRNLKSSEGTHLQGYVITTYDVLQKVFGMCKVDAFDDYKCDAVWEVQTPFGVATIYNYKDGKNYLGKDGMAVKDITEWHVGGHNAESYECVKKLIAAH